MPPSRSRWTIALGMLLVVDMQGWKTIGAQLTPPNSENPKSASAANSIQNPKSEVTDVQIRGNKNIATERILSKLKTHAGRPYNKREVREDIRRLYATRWFYNVEAEENETPEGFDIIYQVIERPKIQEVVYLGNKSIKKKKIQEVTGLEVGKAMDPGINQSVASRLERHYHNKGFPFATVELVEGGERGDSRVVLKITEGPKPRISKILFEGNEFVSESRLRTKISSKASILGMFLGTYDPIKLEEDAGKLIDYYNENGFLDIRVSRELDWSLDREDLRIRYVIDEGPRYKVRGIRFAGVSALEDSDLSEGLRQIAGKTFNRSSLDKDIQLVRDAYGSRGYTHAAVNADIRYLDTPGEIDVVYRITEDFPRRVGRVKVVGNDVTKTSVIINRMEIAPGDLADTTEIRRSQQRLIESRFFKTGQGVTPTVAFDPTNDPDAEYQDLLVSVQEDSTGSMLFGVGVNSDSGVGGSLVINERNFDLFGIPHSFSDIFSGHAFRGAGQEFRLEAVPGTLVQRYSLSFREPRLLGLDYSLATSGYFFRRIFSIYHEQREGGRLTLGQRFTWEFGASIMARIENIGISSLRTIAPDLMSVRGDNFLTSVMVALDHDTRDSHLNPGSGHFIQANYEQAFGDFTFPKFRFEAQQFWTLHSRADGSGRHVLNLRGEVGFAGSQVPVFERYYAGGFRSLRGFDFRGVGPTFGGAEIGGDFMLLSGIEYQLPLTADDGLGLVFFVDGGTVEESVKVTTYRVAVGFGIRVQTPGMGPVPLAFDFGFPIVEGPNDDTQIFSFFMGWFR